jgi:3-hydroxyisobutyrate dehydrogenase-like beta-hydroxyacid dehydrogenase
VVDVAVMAPVPGRGLEAPMLASGEAAGEFAARLAPYGARVEVVPGPVGAAATRKLLRSVFMKGLAAVVAEALAAAQAAGLESWLHEDIVAELTRANASTVDRLVTGSIAHAVRRTHEMAAAVEMLSDLGVPARTTRASHNWLYDLSSGSRP